MTIRQQVADFLGLRRSMAALLAMVILVGLGEKMAERFLPLYLMALGGGALSVGLLNGLDNLLSALYSFPGGYASEKLGYKRALALLNVIAMAGYAVVIAVPSWQAVILGAVLFISWTAISLPATMDMVATVLPRHKRTMGVSLHSLVRRVPMALGPVIGGALIGVYGEIAGMRLAFSVAFVLAGVSLALQQKLIVGERHSSPAPRLEPSRGSSLLSRPLRNLLVADILVRFCEQIPYAFVVSVAAFGGALLWDPAAAAELTASLKVGQALVPFFESVASPATNFIVASACGLTGTLYFALFGKDLGRVATKPDSA